MTNIGGMHFNLEIEITKKKDFMVDNTCVVAVACVKVCTIYML